MAAVVVVPAKPVAKVKAPHVHRATALLHHAAMVRKAPRALKVRGMAAAKADATVVVARNNVAIPVLTTVVMAKAVPHRVVHAQRAVVQAVVVKVAKAVKTAAATMAMNCHATSIP